MRHWFLVLLIALLPLRSGLGDAMAAGLLCPPPATAHVMAADAAMDDSAHAQHGVAHTMDAPAAHAESSPCPDGSLCSACQICHSTAIAPTAVDWIGMVLICFVLPAAIAWALGKVCRRLGWIRDGDLKLD